MKRLAIIPARGGSKRIPRKNIKPFLGKPIIAYSIEAALKSSLFDEVMVSTDDEEIAEIARSFGAKVPLLRSPENADDFATTFDVLQEVNDYYASIGRSFDECCCIYATAPFVTSELLQSAHLKFAQGKYDSLFPVLHFSFPIQRAISLSEGAKMTMFYPEHLTTRSQDLTPAYHDCGMFYWYLPITCLPQGKLWTDNTGCMVIDQMDAHDIDTMTDWEVAEFKFRLKQQENAQ